MKKICSSIIVLLITLFMTITGYCEDEKVRVYFGNGVFNDEERSGEGIAALQVLLDNAAIQGDLKDRIVCDISHNPTDGLLDLFEAAQQITGDAWSAFWRSLAGLDVLPDFLLDEFENIAVKFDEDRVKSNPSIQKHVDKYNEDLCRGDKVIVVAHSQGNLYANIAYGGIDEARKDGFGIVSVANPSWRVAGDDSNEFYTTISEDIVIKVLPWALGSNLDNFSGLNPDDLSGHMFAASYLASGLAAESRILNHIITRILTLEWPTKGSCNAYALITCKVQAGEEFCIVWDLENNQPAEDVNLNSGDPASFPCKKADISVWLADKNLTNIQVLKTNEVENNRLNYSEPIPLISLTGTYYHTPRGCGTVEDPKCLIDNLVRSATDPIWGIDEKGDGNQQRFRFRDNTVYYWDDLPIKANSEVVYHIPVRAPEAFSLEIQSLTNAGGLRSRAAGLEYVETYNYIGCIGLPVWTCISDAAQKGWRYRETKDIVMTYEFRSPFADGSTITIDHADTHLFDDDGNGDGISSCVAVRDYEYFQDQNYDTKGIRNDNYMVLFYLEEEITARTIYPCSFGFECPPDFVGWLTCSNPPIEANYYHEIDFTVKAFTQKAGENENTMDMNPFEIAENNDLGSAMLNLKNYAAGFSAPPVEGSCSQVAFDLYFIE